MFFTSVRRSFVIIAIVVPICSCLFEKQIFHFDFYRRIVHTYSLTHLYIFLYFCFINSHVVVSVESISNASCSLIFLGKRTYHFHSPCVRTTITFAGQPTKTAKLDKGEREIISKKLLAFVQFSFVFINKFIKLNTFSLFLFACPDIEIFVRLDVKKCLFFYSLNTEIHGL